MSNRLTYSPLVFLIIIGTILAGSPAYADPEPEISPQDAICIASFFPRPSPFSHSRTKNRLDRKKLSRKIEAVHQEYYTDFHKRIHPILDVINDIETHPERYQKVLIFWQLGEQIAREKQKHKEAPSYHSLMMTSLAKDCGMELKSIESIERFYRRFTVAATLSLSLTWEHYTILSDVDDAQERAFYQNHAIKHGLSPDELSEAVNNNLYNNRSQNPASGILRL